MMWQSDTKLHNEYDVISSLQIVFHEQYSCYYSGSLNWFSYNLFSHNLFSLNFNFVLVFILPLLHSEIWCDKVILNYTMNYDVTERY